MPFSVGLIRKLERVDPELREVLLALLEEVERQREESVTKKEFLEFARQTEENFQKVWKAINELAEAQKRTEQRVNELAEAQKRTEEELRELSAEHRKTRKMLGGLSDTVGYGLEDQIFPYIEDFVRKEYALEPEVVDRRVVVYPDGSYDEANIYVEGRRKGEKVLVVGECKSRPSKKEANRFSKMLERMRRHLGCSVDGFLVGYYYTPEVLGYLSERYPEIKVMKSFEFRLRYKTTMVS